MEGQDVDGFEAVFGLAGCGDELACLVLGEGVYFGFFWSRGSYAGGVAWDEGVAYGLFEGLVEGYVDVVDGAWGEAAVQLLAIEAADVAGGEGCQLDAAEGGA